MRWDIGIDLGTENVRVAELRQGPALDMPAAMAFREGRMSPICAGDIARRLIGRACEGVSVHYPLADGVLENNFYAERLFRWLFTRTDILKKRRHYNAIIACQPFARPVQREALMNAAIEAGAAEAMLVRSDVATALGAGLDILAPEAKLLVDIGAGKVSATLFTFGRVAAYGYLPYGLNRIDERIRSIMRVKYGYRVSHAAAVEIKHTLGNAMPDKAPADVIMHTTGVNMSDRRPRTFDVETQPVLDACEDMVSEIERMCAAVVDAAPEGLSADLTDAGIVLAGAGATMTEMDRRLGQALGLPCRVADAPATCGARGMAKIVEDPAPWANMMQGRQARSVWR